MLAAALTTLFIASALAQSAPSSANASALATENAQWTASGFNQALPNSNSFGVPLQAQAIMTVVYGNTQVQNGQSLSAAQTAQQPTIFITPAAASNFTSSNAFTLILADASAAGGIDTQGDYRHYLANNIPGGSSGSGSFQLGGGQTQTQYAGPGPLPNSGAHRYAWMLFQQPASFNAPAGYNAPGHWQVSQYVQQSGLGSLVAASWFTVSAEGQATFSPVATSSTSVVLAAVSTPTGTASQTVSRSATVAAPAATSSSPANQVVASGIFAGFAGLFGLMMA